MIKALAACAAALFLALPAGAGPGADATLPAFAVTGNTSPDSPFVGFNENYPALVEALNRDNPLFVVHTGNLVRGGNDRIGVIEKDISRQLAVFSEDTKRLTMPLYPTAGELDLYNGSADLFSKHFGRGPNYSFNYDDIHIIMFNTIAGGSQAYDIDRQMRWLEADLENSKKRGMVIVVMHHCMFPQARGEKPFEGAERIHGILKQYRVRAVISGDRREFFTVQKDSISYINAGCGGFTREEPCRGCAQYYMVTVKNGVVKAAPRYIKMK